MICAAAFILTFIKLAISSDQAQFEFFEAARTGRLTDLQTIYQQNPSLDLNWINPAKLDFGWPLQGATTLFAAAHGCYELTGPKMGNDQVEIFRLLIRWGAKLGIKDSLSGTPPLVLAIDQCNTPQVWEIARLMIDAGAIITETNYTPLMAAAGTGKTSVIELLLDRGAPIDYRDQRNGKTALLEAAQYNQLESVRALLRRRASLSIKSFDGKTALQFAVDNKASAVVSLLLEALEITPEPNKLASTVRPEKKNLESDNNSLTTAIVACTCILMIAIAIAFFSLKKSRKHNHAASNDPAAIPLVQVENFVIPWSAIELSAICIGSGNFGKVFIGKFHLNGELMRVAGKTLKDNPTEAERDILEKEIAVMRKITEVCGTHENLIRLVGYTDGPKRAILMDYCQLGNLKDVLLNLRNKNAEQILNLVSQDEGIVADDFYITVDRARYIDDMPTSSCQQELRNINSVGSDGIENRPLLRILLKFARQICAGMDHLAANSFVHRDLAARNVLVCDYNLVKISDYGLARDVFETGIYSASGGTLPIRWMAPEALQNQYTTASDVWSLGVVLWELFTLAELPYSGLKNSEIAFKLQENLKLERPFKNCPNEMYDEVMLQCWHLMTERRPTFRNLSKTISQITETYWIDRNNKSGQASNLA